MSVFMCTCIFHSTQTFGGHRTTEGNQSPSTMWDASIKLRSSGLVTSTLPIEPHLSGPIRTDTVVENIPWQNIICISHRCGKLPKGSDWKILKGYGLMVRLWAPRTRSSNLLTFLLRMSNVKHTDNQSHMPVCPKILNFNLLTFPSS